jgi:hypothetical protein
LQEIWQLKMQKLLKIWQQPQNRVQLQKKAKPPQCQLNN